MRADLDLVEAVENIELRQRDAIDAGCFDRLPRQNGVEPAAAAPPAGVGAELPPAIADQLADGIMQFAGKGPAADAGRIGLGDAENIADRAGSKSRADGRRWPRRCWTR